MTISDRVLYRQNNSVVRSTVRVGWVMNHLLNLTKLDSLEVVQKNQITKMSHDSALLSCQLFGVWCRVRVGKMVECIYCTDAHDNWATTILYCRDIQYTHK